MSSESPSELSTKTVDAKASTARHMLRGAAWAVLMRWGIRFIGIINLIILARLLTVEELGVVALATLVVGLIRQFYAIGIPMLLIRKQEIDRADCDTAWTLRMCMGAVMAVAMALCAPMVAKYFEEPRMVDVTYVLAVAFFVASGMNVGMVLARRELDFAKDFRFHVYIRLITFLATIGLAFWWRTVWAVVVGTLVSSIAEVVLSFRMHNYRPRFCLKHYREYLRFGLAIIPLNLGQYLVQKADSWVVAGIASTSRFSAYNMGSELSASFTQEIVGTIARGLYPNYTRLASRPAELSAAFCNVLSSISLLVLPLGVGLAMVSRDAVLVLLGEQWLGVGPLLPWLAIYWAVSAINTLLAGQVLIATGHERVSAAMTWVRLAILLPAAILGGQIDGAAGVAKGVLASAIIAFPLVVAVLVWTSLLSVRQVARATWRPVVATAAMAAALGLPNWSGSEVAIIRLATDVAGGAFVYLITVWALWLLSGRPSGTEGAVLGYALRKFRREQAS